ncbi:hypothetical protein HK096_008369 [Nowakowskiella sp. JEL0078]|nr:hypothetical protein HK096_008369 [Nowakowskiella sp. JEL0078]
MSLLDLEMGRTDSVDPKVVIITSMLGKKIIPTSNQYIALLEKSGLKMLKGNQTLMFGKSYQIVEMGSKNFEIDFEAKSKDLLPFFINTVWIIGPYLDDIEKFKVFMTKTGGAPMESKKLESIVRGIVDGECRGLVASMTLREVTAENLKEKCNWKIFNLYFNV